MRLILLRHGIAEDSFKSPDGSDAARRLTPEGVLRTKTVAASLSKWLDKPDMILASPRIRARQTADIASKAFDSPVREVASLGEGDVLKIMQAIRDADAETVMIVGHEPTFSGITELICFGRVSGNLIMKKAGCAVVDLIWGVNDEVAGQLIALIPPGISAGPR